MYWKWNTLCWTDNRALGGTLYTGWANFRSLCYSLLLRSLIFSKTMNPPCKCQLSTPLGESLAHAKSSQNTDFWTPSKISKLYTRTRAAWCVLHLFYTIFIHFTKRVFRLPWNWSENRIFMFKVNYSLKIRISSFRSHNNPSLVEVFCVL